MTAERGSMTDPFVVLGVDVNVGDEEVKRRYLELVRTFPPDREPQRFQAYRAAYEALRDHRARLEAKLLHIHNAALARLKLHVLAAGKPGASRASASTVSALLIEGVTRACSGRSPPLRTK